MTSVMRTFIAGAAPGQFRFNTAVASNTEDSQRRAQARAITPPTSNQTTRPTAGDDHTGSAIKSPRGVLGLDLLSVAAENQVVEDIIDETLKDFDLATCTKNLRSYKTV